MLNLKSLYGFIYYGNIKESVFKRQIRFLRNPLGKLGVIYGLYLSLVEKRVVDFLFAIIERFAHSDVLIRRKRLC